MKNNPYTEMLQLMQKMGSKDNPATMQIATVLSIEPLLIKIGDLQLTKDNLLINESLLKHERDFSINVQANGNVNGFHGSGSLTNININKQKIYFENTLKANDTVVVIEIENGQKYIVFMKVV